MADDGTGVHRDSVDYWRRVTSECDPLHPAPGEEVLSRFLDSLELEAGTRVLDVGAGFGRIVPMLLHRKAIVHGIDIDPRMVKAARGVGGSAARLCVGDATYLSYRSGVLGAVVCWAVFDELAQTSVLLEVNRALAVGGKFLLTGKNSAYLADDHNALAAEKGARAKRHRNHFTHFDAIDWPSLGFEVSVATYFLRRGDFAEGRGVDCQPERFYEYALILAKTGSATVCAEDVPLLYSRYSRTYLEVRGMDADGFGTEGQKLP